MQVWSIVAAPSAFATCPSRTHREPVFPPHYRQHTDGKTALRHVQELERLAMWNCARCMDIR